MFAPKKPSVFKTTDGSWGIYKYCTKCGCEKEIFDDRKSPFCSICRPFEEDNFSIFIKTYFK